MAILAARSLSLVVQNFVQRADKIWAHFQNQFVNQVNRMADLN